MTKVLFKCGYWWRTWYEASRVALCLMHTCGIMMAATWMPLLQHSISSSESGTRAVYPHRRWPCIVKIKTGSSHSVVSYSNRTHCGHQGWNMGDSLQGRTLSVQRGQSPWAEPLFFKYLQWYLVPAVESTSSLCLQFPAFLDQLHLDASYWWIKSFDICWTQILDISMKTDCSDCLNASRN